jgi:cytochrome c556
MRVRVYVGALLVVAWSGSLAVAQGQKITTPEQLDKVMKGVGPAFRNTNKAVNSAAWADAKKELATARAGVLESQSFWIEYKKDDAVALNKTALEKIDALDKLISGATPDAAAAGAALKEVGQSCAACHKQYRAQDADNNYILKPGSVEGIK